jgi:hypothetical protein
LTNIINGFALLGLNPLAKAPGQDPARVQRFRTFAMNVSQIYDGDGEPVEMKIETGERGRQLRRPLRSV